MYPTPGPLRRRPNYTLRRLVAATGAFLVLWLLYSVVTGIFGDDGSPDRRLTAESATTSTTRVTLEAPPPCEYLEDQSIYASVDDWHRTILDTQYALPDQYEPPDLVPASTANYSAEYLIREIIAEDLNGLRNGILRAGVPEVALIAAYRSIEDQAELFDARVAELGEQAALEGTARPGHSEHHLGTAIDVRPIGADDVDQSFGDTPTGRWLEDHSWEYGFILSYPQGKEDVTCYKYEPWHFRYVGVELARRIHESGLTLREYLWHWEVTGSEPGVSPSAVTTSSTTSEPDE